MSRVRNEREANHVIAWGGCMSPYRLHAQHYTPAPARRINFLRRVLRAILKAIT